MSVWRFVFDVTPAYIYDFPYARIETGFSLLGDSLEQLQDLQMTTVYLGAALAVIGVFLGIATPIGGVLEILGATLFLSVTPSEEFVGGLHGTYYYQRIGPFIALISGSLMVLSMILPIALRRKPSLSDLRTFLWTFTIHRQSDRSDQMQDRMLGADLATWIPARSSRSRTVVAALVAVAVIAASVGLSLNDSYSKESAKIAILVIVDTSDETSFSLSVDGRTTAFGTDRDILRNYYVEAGEHHIEFTLITPLLTESSFDIRLLPLQTEVVSFHVTDTALEVS